ncbi:MAG TPA: hypothetical protein VGS12_13520 [Caulobacteraceae bacterium]|nr:hypothetical protein [Caulobacteraceae bacterium]
MVVAGAALDEWRRRVAALDGAVFDGRALTLADFQDWAEWEGTERWVRYALEDAKVLIDRVGHLATMTAAKARVPPGKATAFVAASLDHFVNQVYRCAKCVRDGDPFAGRLEAVEAVNPLLDALFALDAGRARPYAKHLRWEIENRPPAGLPLTGAELLDLLTGVLSPSPLAALQVLVRRLEPHFRASGHGAVLDAWGATLPWIRGPCD